MMIAHRKRRGVGRRAAHANRNRRLGVVCSGIHLAIRHNKSWLGGRCSGSRGRKPCLFGSPGRLSGGCNRSGGYYRLVSIEDMSAVNAADITLAKLQLLQAVRKFGKTLGAACG